MPDDELDRKLNDDVYEDAEATEWEWHCYLFPVIQCRHCRNWMEMPYSNLPETDEGGRFLIQREDPPELPPEGWSATFGCRVCGHVLAYGAADVTNEVTHKEQAGQYQSGKGVHAAEFPCGQKDCKTPAQIYVDIGRGNANDVVQFLRGVLYGQCLSGHSLKTVPEKYYKVVPVLHRLW